MTQTKQTPNGFTVRQQNPHNHFEQMDKDIAELAIGLPGNFSQTMDEDDIVPYEEVENVTENMDVEDDVNSTVRQTTQTKPQIQTEVLSLMSTNNMKIEKVSVRCKLRTHTKPITHLTK